MVSVDQTILCFHFIPWKSSRPNKYYVFFDIHGSSRKNGHDYHFFGMAPSLDASDHQDDITCLVGDSNLNLRFPLLQGGGHIHGSFGFPILPTSAVALKRRLVDHDPQIHDLLKAVYALAPEADPQVWGDEMSFFCLKKLWLLFYLAAYLVLGWLFHTFLGLR